MYVQLRVSIHTESSSGLRAKPLKHSSKVNFFFAKISGGPVFFLMSRREARFLMCLISMLNSRNCPSMLNKTPLRQIRKAAKNTR